MIRCTSSAAATETIFDGGSRSAAVDYARATYDQYVADYRQTVLSAFQQVEDELVALRVLEQEAKVRDEAAKSADLAVKLTLNEYKAGTVDYTSVVTAQNTALSAAQSERAAKALTSDPGRWLRCDR